MDRNIEKDFYLSWILVSVLHNLTQWSDRAEMWAKYTYNIVSMASQTEHWMLWESTTTSARGKKVWIFLIGWIISFGLSDLLS